ncbi:hypothetical protein Tco_1354402 [Tanacetum coccineum]
MVEWVKISYENVPSNGEWVKISMRKVHTLLEMEDNDDRKVCLDYLCIDLNYVKEQRVKLDFLTMHHVNTEILKENKNLRTELKELKAITKTWLNSSNKVNQFIGEQIITLKKKENYWGVDQLTKDSSNSGLKDIVFVKSLFDDTKVTIPGVERPRLSEVEGFILPNHDTGRILPYESQRNTTDPSVAVTDSSTTNYDSADESSVCSTPLPPLKKLDGAEPISGPKTIKLILRSKSTFKVEALKSVIINEPSSAPAKGNKSFSTSKVHSAPSGKLKSVKIKDDPPLAFDIRMPIWCGTLDSGCSRHMTGVKSYLHKYMEQPGPKVVFGDNSTCTTKGYDSIKCNGIVFTKFDEKRRTIFNSNKEIVMIAPRVRDVYDLYMTSSAQKSFYIHNHKDHLEKFEEKADDGYLLGYSLVFKAFKVFNTRRQQTEETYHITFDESHEAIKFSKPSVDNVKIDMPEGVLVLSGLSRVGKSRTRDLILRDSSGNDMEGGLWRLPFYCTPPAAANVAIPDPTLVDLAAGTPSAKSSGSTSRPNLFVGNDDDEESDDDEDACVEIPLITLIRSAATIPVGARSQLLCSYFILLRPTVMPLTMDFFPFTPSPYYATYSEDGVVHGSYEVTDLNDKVSSSDAAFVKDKAKVSECSGQKDAEGELLSLIANAGFERGLRMDQTKELFDATPKKISRFMPGAQSRLIEATLLVATTDYPFLNKVVAHSTQPLFDIVDLKPDRLSCLAVVPTPRAVGVSPPVPMELTITPAPSSVELFSK